MLTVFDIFDFPHFPQFAQFPHFPFFYNIHFIYFCLSMSVSTDTDKWGRSMLWACTSPKKVVTEKFNVFNQLSNH